MNVSSEEANRKSQLFSLVKTIEKYAAVSVHLNRSNEDSSQNPYNVQSD